MKKLLVLCALLILTACGQTEPVQEEPVPFNTNFETYGPETHSAIPEEPPAAPLLPVNMNGFAPLPPAIQTEYALIAETHSGQILFAKNEHERVYPASLTKIMTALLVTEAEAGGDVSFDDTVTVSREALQNLSVHGNSAGLQIGEQLTVRDLLYCAMVVSANEACNVLGEYIAGSVSDFVELMNKRAAEIGAVNTQFKNTHGLHEEGHYSTVYDMYLITTEARKLPAFLKLTAASGYTVPATNYSEARGLLTTNHLASALRNSLYHYRYAVSGKTGFTTPAGFCLMSAAKKNGLETVCVVMKAGRYDDNRMASFVDSEILHEWVFNNYTR
jgi:D-alanyl-D-alanine carboxypeptidase (penicillin-binding protein 5/6)